MRHRVRLRVRRCRGAEVQRCRPVELVACCVWDQSVTCRRLETVWDQSLVCSCRYGQACWHVSSSMGCLRSETVRDQDSKQTPGVLRVAWGPRVVRGSRACVKRSPRREACGATPFPRKGRRRVLTERQVHYEPFTRLLQCSQAPAPQSSVSPIYAQWRVSSSARRLCSAGTAFGYRPAQHSGAGPAQPSLRLCWHRRRRLCRHVPSV